MTETGNASTAHLTRPHPTASPARTGNHAASVTNTARRSCETTAHVHAQISCFSSLLTYSAHDGSVTDVRLLSDDASDAMHVASIDSTGQLHLWDVSVQPRKAVSQRPTLAFPPAGPSQVNLDSGHLCKLLVWGPLLLVASEAGGIRAYDPRAGGRGVWSMAVPPSHGVVTCMAAVPGAPALCSGTTRGMMHVWDMRMQVRAAPPARVALSCMRVSMTPARPSSPSTACMMHAPPNSTTAPPPTSF